MINTISKEKKKALFPFLAYILTRQTDPDFQDLYPKVKTKDGKLIDSTPYRAAQSIEDWSTLIQSNEEDATAIITLAESLTDEDWNKLETKYQQAQADGSVVMAAKGAKLKTLKAQKGAMATAITVDKKKKLPKELTPKTGEKPKFSDVKQKIDAKANLKMLKEGSKVKKKKKCSCGCDMILTKATGGKVIETCSCKCGGKLKKK